jgi:Fe-S oxidoreductase
VLKVKMSEITKRNLDGDLYSCAQCGYCQEACPIYEEIPWESASPRGKLYWIKGILTEGFLRPNIEIDENFVKRLFQCTLCGRCHEICQTSLDTMGLWNSARAEVHLSGMRPENLNSIAENLEETKNPYGLDPDMRLDWADYTDLEDVPLKDEAEIAYFVGCTTAFKGANHNTGYSTAQLLNHLEEDWTLLGEDEWCCGSPLIMAGDEDAAKEFAEHNIAEIERRDIKTLLTGCPSCFRMWKFEIPELLGRELSFKVKHCLEHIHQRIEEGRITPTPARERITYHDPCELSRLGGVLDEPREILRAFSTDFVEMPEHGMDVRCCGGGGLLQATDNELRLSIAKYRLEQANSVGAEVLASACPACNLTFLDAVRATGNDIEVLDVTEYIARQLGLN